MPSFNASAYFIGDSMSMQHYHTFACQLHADVPAHPMPEVASLEGSTCSVRRDCRPGRVCHVRASGANTSLAASVASALLSAGVLSRGDLVVANEGLWHRALHREGWSGELQHLRAMQRPLCEMQRRGVVPLWRETTAQHFGTPSGQYWPTGCKKEQQCGQRCRLCAQ